MDILVVSGWYKQISQGYVFFETMSGVTGSNSHPGENGAGKGELAGVLLEI